MNCQEMLPTRAVYVSPGLITCVWDPQFFL